MILFKIILRNSDGKEISLTNFSCDRGSKLTKYQSLCAIAILIDDLRNFMIQHKSQLKLKRKNRHMLFIEKLNSET